MGNLATEEGALEFWASSETDVLVSINSEMVRGRVEPYLNMAFARSTLATVELKLRYVPIIMRPEWAEHYPARSKARIKERIYVCAPQLDYQTFLSGSRQDQVAEYIRGIGLTSSHLSKFGATWEHVEAFETIIFEALAGAMEGPDPKTPNLG